GAQRLAVRSLGDQGGEVVHGRQDSRAERNVFAAEACGVAVAVPSLVVAANQIRDGVRKWYAGDDVGANLRMPANLVKLFLRQRSGLGEDVVWHGQLPDIPEQRSGLDPLNVRIGHP